MSARFRAALQSGRVLLMDGAMGTELIRLGLEPYAPAHARTTEGQTGDDWNRLAPQKVLAIHKSYVAAGANCLLSNSFLKSAEAFATRCPRRQLMNFFDQSSNTLTLALELARTAAGPDNFVLADLGTINAPNEPALWHTTHLGDVRNERVPVNAADLLLAFSRNAAQADAILLETQTDMGVVANLLRLLRTSEDALPPLLVSFTYGKIESSEGVRIVPDPARVAAMVDGYQDLVFALGVNCGANLDLDTILGILKTYREHTRLPLLARPNAGTPTTYVERSWRSLFRPRRTLKYSMTPEELAARVPDFVAAGVTLFGGCCGTTPAHVAACKAALGKLDVAWPPG